MQKGYLIYLFKYLFISSLFIDSLKHKIMQHLKSNLQHFCVYSVVYIHHKIRKKRMRSSGVRTPQRISAFRLFWLFGFPVYVHCSLEMNERNKTF